MDNYQKLLVDSTMKIIRGRELLLSVQWHITERCINKCKHCYIYDENYKTKREMTTSECYWIIDKIRSASLYYGKTAMISFIGGDPLVRTDIFDLVKYSIDSGIFVQIKSVPESLSEDVIKKLYNIGVKYFQISVDGMPRIHDFFRGKGSFRRTRECVTRLKKYDIITTIKYTLSKYNSEDIFKVMEIVSKWGVSAFTFTRYVPLGNGINEKIDIFTPSEYKTFLYRMYDKEKELSLKYTTQFIHRDHLWELMCYEKGVYRDLFSTLYFDNKVNYGGCSGWLHSIVIDVDGNCYTCRKNPKLNIGNILEHNIINLFEIRDTTGFTDRSNYKDCLQCEVFSFCRSCPAISQSLLNDPYAKDPYCWKEN